MPSRRCFFTAGVSASLTQLPLLTANSVDSSPAGHGQSASLNGEWLFRSGPDGRADGEGWRNVRVPHTWQIETETADYMGVGWYRKEFEAPSHWKDCAVRVEFEAVFHSAIVQLNEVEVGRHTGKGYTAFTCDLHPHLRFDKRNTVTVKVDNSFSEAMLPRGRSSDWAHDGGIYRPINLLITPKVFIERLAIDPALDLFARDADLDVTAVIRNTGSAAWRGNISYAVVDDRTGLIVLNPPPVEVALAAGETRPVRWPAGRLSKPALWHFDDPNLYRLTASLSNNHELSENFGVRKIETRDGAFFLNGERVRLMGVERMGGSNPEYGMAEPSDWIEHDLAEMKELNCVYTRVHWPQDRRVLDWCDRHGMLIQTEVPTWGPNTFQDMDREPAEAIMNNGLEQLREMIHRDRNHPCIFSWGVCNEVGGQNPPAYAFAKRMYDEAKKLDPSRLVTYASNSLQKTPEKDVAGLMDYIMWNEYYETWFGGTTQVDMARNLDEIHRAFPGKAIVISEYGWCSCTTELKENDGKRIDILRRQDAEFRKRSYIAGLIYFCYNDYRTHIGHEGVGVMKQRGGGVVDLYGARKGSFDQLRTESSPIESLKVAGSAGRLEIAVMARNTVPSYPLRGYSIRAIVYGQGDVPLERLQAPLPELPAGNSAAVEIRFSEKQPVRVQVDLMRPTGVSAQTTLWKPS